MTIADRLSRLNNHADVILYIILISAHLSTLLQFDRYCSNLPCIG